MQHQSMTSEVNLNVPQSYVVPTESNCVNEIRLRELELDDSHQTLKEATDSTEALVEQDLLLVAKARMRERVRWQAKAIMTLIMCVPVIVMACVWGKLIGGSLGYDVLLGILAMLMGIVAIFCLRRANHSVGFDAEELALREGVRAIPTLMQSLVIDGSDEARRGIYRALALVLPQLKASDAGLLTVAHRVQLNHLLRSETDSVFRYTPYLGCSLAILKAFEQVGDTRAISTVEVLATRSVFNERQRRLQQAAKECLPLLRVNASVVEAHQTLLRSSSALEVAADSLLRPVVTDNQLSSPSLGRELLRANYDGNE